MAHQRRLALALALVRHRLPLRAARHQKSLRAAARAGKRPRPARPRGCAHSEQAEGKGRAGLSECAHFGPMGTIIASVRPIFTIYVCVGEVHTFVLSAGLQLALPLGPVEALS